jgi:hypothetical protein
MKRWLRSELGLHADALTREHGEVDGSWDETIAGTNWLIFTLEPCPAKLNDWDFATHEVVWSDLASLLYMFVVAKGIRNGQFHRYFLVMRLKLGILKTGTGYVSARSCCRAREQCPHHGSRDDVSLN